MNEDGTPTLTLTQTTAELTAALAQADLSTSKDERGRLARFLQALREETARLNLTSIRDPAEALQRHVVEPLMGWRRLAATAEPEAVVDVGSGGGAPGVPIAIVAPTWAVTLLESRQRRAAYLQRLAAALGLAMVSVVEQRAEAFAHRAGREAFALAVSRALAPPPAALEASLPLVRLGGEAVVYAGPGAREWLGETERAAVACGGGSPRLEPVSWPGATVELVLMRVRKERSTPANLPRRMRQMRKGPPRAS